MKFFLHNWRNGLLALIVTRRPYGPWHSCTQGRRVSSHLSRSFSWQRDNWHMMLLVTLLGTIDFYLVSRKYRSPPHEMGHSSVTGCIIWNVTRNWHERSEGHGVEISLNAASLGFNIGEWESVWDREGSWGRRLIDQCLFSLKQEASAALQARRARGVIRLIDWWRLSRLYFGTGSLQL